MRHASTWFEQAVDAFDNTDHKDGDLLSLEWLKEILQVPTTGEEREKQFIFMSRFGAFKDYLLTQRKVALENIRGRGYRIVPPDEQADFAVEVALKHIRKGLHAGSALLTHVRTHLLTNEQQASHVDRQIKLAGLRQMLGRQNKDLLTGPDHVP